MTKRLLPVAMAWLFVGWPILQAEQPRVQIDCKSPVACLAWSPKGDLIAAGSADKTARIFDAVTGKELQCWTTDGTVPALAFSPDGKILAVANGQGGPSVTFWNVQSGKEEKTNIPYNNYLPEHIAFTDDGKALRGVSVKCYFQMKFTGEVNGSSSAFGLRSRSGCSGIAPDGSLCAKADATGHVLFQHWDPLPLTSSDTLPVISTQLNAGQLQCLAISSRGKVIAMAGLDKNEVQVWDVVKLQEIRSFSGLPRSPIQLGFSADGKTLAGIASGGATLYVWDLSRNNDSRRQINHSRGMAGLLALSADGRFLATTGLEGKGLFIWSVTTRDLTHKGPPLKLTAKELGALWATLSDKDYDKSDAAWHKVAASGDNAVPFLKEKIWPTVVPLADMTQIAKWVADLDAEKFALREKATKELLAAGEVAIIPLEDVLKKHPSEEVVFRAKLILKQLAQPVLTPERLRVLEVIELLEAVRTEQAIAVLEAIGRETRVTQIQAEAEQALKRMADVKAKK